MDYLFDVDWNTMFSFDTPLLEIFLRGSLVYLSLFILLRLILKRQAGTIGITDLLVIVLIADAAQNAMANDYKSVPDGIILVTTLIFWNFALEWLGYKFKPIGRFIHPGPLQLVKEGRMIIPNMRHELITREELMSQLRQQGIEHLKDVKRACMEGDGKISVVKYDKSDDQRKSKETNV